MDTLNASTGDVIEIKGKKKNSSRMSLLYPSDEGKGIIESMVLVEIILELQLVTQFLLEK